MIVRHCKWNIIMDMIYILGVIIMLQAIINRAEGSKVLAMRQMIKQKENSKDVVSATSNLFRETYAKCKIKARDEFLVNKRINDLMQYNVKMIEFSFEFEGYTVNPLILNNSIIYNGDKWTRVNNYSGEVLLSLSTSYGIMSLMTLTLGVENMDITLFDSPIGCTQNLTEQEKTDAMLYLLMRDFRYNASDMILKQRQRICHETVDRAGSGQLANFGDKCCHIDPVTGAFQCADSNMNTWLRFLFMSIAVLKLLVLLFGPILFISSVLSLESNLVPYAVKLKDPLIKTICVCNAGSKIALTYDKVLDLRTRRGFEKLRNSCRDISLGEPVKVKFNRYDILVNYDRLHVENEIPVGLLKSLSDAFFKCQIRDIGPFQSCCASEILPKHCSTKQSSPYKWIDVFRIISSVLAVLLAPFLYYIRLIIYYIFEQDEVLRRKATLESLNLDPVFDGSVLLMLTPTHWIFIIIYVLYFVTALVFGLMSGSKRDDRMKRIIIAAFTDLQNFSWLQSLHLLMTNIIWPFNRFGLAGLIVAPIYWVFFLPFTLVIYLIYSIPAAYIALRLLHHAKSTRNRSLHLREHSASYRIETVHENSMNKFETGRMCNNIGLKDPSAESLSDLYSLHSNLSNYDAATTRRNQDCHFSRHIIENLLVMTLFILTMYGVLLILSECVGLLVEMFALSVMGVITNAGALLRYISLFILLIVYSYTAYADVGKKYHKTIKCLFAELKKRCKDIDDVTSLPSHLQENFGFKSQELSEQADYELPDDIDCKKDAHWLINDLVLFIDNEDMPRLPKNLFHEVCQIRTVGSPGPVYMSLIDATQSFLKIAIFVFFVFIVVATFGSVYQVSSTNQMVATMAGGALPMFMRKFFQSSKFDIEFDAVSFRNKLEEIIKNFQQAWPIYDLPFELWTERDAKKIADEGLNERSYYRQASLLVHSLPKDDIRHLCDVHKQRLESQHDSNGDNSGLLRESRRSFSESALNIPNESRGESGTVQNSVTSHTSTRPYDIDLLIYLPGDDLGETQWCDKWSDLDDNREVFDRIDKSQKHHCSNSSLGDPTTQV